MNTWLSRMLSDPHGTPDDARVLAVLLVLAYITLASWNVVALHHSFDMLQFGTGAGTLSGGIGAWLGLRKGN